MRQLVTTITSCRAVSYRKAVAPASVSRPRLITPCEQVRLVLDSDGQGLPQLNGLLAREDSSSLEG